MKFEIIKYYIKTEVIRDNYTLYYKKEILIIKHCIRTEVIWDNQAFYYNGWYLRESSILKRK